MERNRTLCQFHVTAVFLIADDWAAQIGQLHTNLVKTPGKGLYFQQTAPLLILQTSYVNLANTAPFCPLLTTRAFLAATSFNNQFSTAARSFPGKLCTQAR